MNASNSSILSFQNRTNLTIVPQDAHALGVVLLIQSALIFSGSLLVLVAIYRNAFLQTAFNLHLVSILLGGLLMALHAFAEFLSQFVPGMWPFIVHHRLCPVFTFTFIYGEFVMAATHLLIALNRGWAMYFPHHYRMHFTKTLSLVDSVAVWVVAAGLVVPWVTLMNGRPYAETEWAYLCAIDMRATPLLSLIVIGFFFLSTVIILLSYPVLWFKHAKRRRSRVRQRAVLRGNEAVAPERSAKSHGFAVLSCITASVFLFWLPEIVSGVVQALSPGHVAKSRIPVWLNVWTIFGNCFDPWILILTIPSIRAKVAELLSSCCRRKRSAAPVVVPVMEDTLNTT